MDYVIIIVKKSSSPVQREALKRKRKSSQVNLRWHQRQMILLVEGESLALHYFFIKLKKPCIVKPYSYLNSTNRLLLIITAFFLVWNTETKGNKRSFNTEFLTFINVIINYNLILKAIVLKCRRARDFKPKQK